ncbi:MAG: hypothetical protein ACUVXE_00825 [Anaerolineae bacterium]
MCIECGCGTRAQWVCPLCGGRVVLINNEMVCTLCGATLANVPLDADPPPHSQTQEESEMSEEIVRLQRLLPHWIEHNEEHAEEFQKWSERARIAGETHVADHLLAAARMLNQANEVLQGALDHLGGVPANYPHAHE